MAQLTGLSMSYRAIIRERERDRQTDRQRVNPIMRDRQTDRDRQTIRESISSSGRQSVPRRTCPKRRERIFWNSSTLRFSASISCAEISPTACVVSVGGSLNRSTIDRAVSQSIYHPSTLIGRSISQST